MTPKKIIIYTRAVQVHFHVALARRLAAEFPQAEVLFVSFFSQAVEISRAEGFNAIHFSKELQELSCKRITEERVAEIDAFCRSEYVGLNAMLQMERFLPKNREDAEDFMMRHLTLLDEIIETDTLSISSMYDHFIYVAAGVMAFEKGGAHFAFVGCGVPSGRIIGLKTPWETWVNQASDEDASSLLERSKMEVIRPPEDRIEYMSKTPTRAETLGYRQRLKIARRLADFNRRDIDSGSYFSGDSPNWLFNAIRWRCKVWRTRLREDPWDIDTAGALSKIVSPCVFLALHMEPEATIFMYSPRFRDQLEICRLVSESLPAGFILLVKENPRMVGKREFGYYEAIKKFPNVRLVSTRVPSPLLLEKSEAVVSIAGTVTIEACLRGKKAYCFGKPPFHRMANALGMEVVEALTRFDPEQREDPMSSTFTKEEDPWARWIQGTFIGKGGKSVYTKEIGQLTWDPSSENVEAHFSFITGALGVSTSSCCPL